MVRWIHLQDGPAHDLSCGHRVAGRGEPHVVGQHLLRVLMTGDGEQRPDPRRLVVILVLARPGPPAYLQDRAARPDLGHHRVGVAHVSRELGELAHRIVAGRRRIFRPGRRDQPCPFPGFHDVPVTSTYRRVAATRTGPGGRAPGPPAHLAQGWMRRIWPCPAPKPKPWLET